jgi:hypothetical protein
MGCLSANLHVSLGLVGLRHAADRAHPLGLGRDAQDDPRRPNEFA